VRLFSRGGHDWSGQLPAIVEAMRSLPVRSVIIDGEVVICGADGVSQFDRLRAVFGRRGLVLVCFQSIQSLLKTLLLGLRISTCFSLRIKTTGNLLPPHQGIKAGGHVGVHGVPDSSADSLIYGLMANANTHGQIGKVVRFFDFSVHQASLSKWPHRGHFYCADNMSTTLEAK
jgi:hypothetical protein